MSDDWMTLNDQIAASRKFMEEATARRYIINSFDYQETERKVLEHGRRHGITVDERVRARCEWLAADYEKQRDIAEENRTANEDTDMNNECPQCFGTGYYKGFGAPCPSGCASETQSTKRLDVDPSEDPGGTVQVMVNGPDGLVPLAQVQKARRYIEADAAEVRKTDREKLEAAYRGDPRGYSNEQLEEKIKRQPGFHTGGIVKNKLDGMRFLHTRRTPRQDMADTSDFFNLHFVKLKDFRHAAEMLLAQLSRCNETKEARMILTRMGALTRVERTNIDRRTRNRDTDTDTDTDTGGL